MSVAWCWARFVNGLAPCAYTGRSSFAISGVSLSVPSVTSPAAPRTWSRVSRIPPADCRAALATAVHHEHVAGRDGLDRLALRVVVVLVDVERVEVLAGRDVAQREGGAGHPRFRQRLQPVQERVPEAPCEQLRADRGRAGLLEELQRAVRCHHGTRLVVGTPQPSLVRGQGPAVLRPSLADPTDGVRPRGLRGQARDRGREHVERDQPVPHAPARPRRRTSSAACGRRAGFHWRSRLCR